jgi:hypothetical protein
LSTINILIRKDHYKIWLRKTVVVPNTSASVQTTLPVEAHLAEGGQCLLEEQTLNKAKSLIYLAGTRRLVSKTKGQNLEPR